MMDNVFAYPDVKSVVICGDVHGEFRELAFRLCVRYGMSDTLLIVAGDCGFGFEKPAYYEQVFSRISPKLSKANNYIAMVRGNHDDPSYFNEQRVRHKRFYCCPLKVSEQRDIHPQCCCNGIADDFSEGKPLS